METMNYFEEAEHYRELLHQGTTQMKLKTDLGISQSTISNKMRLLTLSPDIRKFLIDHCLTERHARAILKIRDNKMKMRILNIIHIRGLNVRDSEELINKVLNGSVLVNNVRGFIQTIRHEIDVLKKAGIKVAASQLAKDDCLEITIRIPRKKEMKLQ